MPIGIILLNVQYRLSRTYTGGVDKQTYHRIIAFNKPFTSPPGPYFIEGFDTFEFILESHASSWSFRKNTLVPYMNFDFDRLQIIGNEVKLPTMRSRLSLTPAPFDLKINEEEDAFSCKLQDIDASPGKELDVYNCTSLGTNTDINFFYRDVRSINCQRNILSARAKLVPTPVPEQITDPLLEII